MTDAGAARRLSVCGGPRCTDRGSHRLLHVAEEHVRREGLAGKVAVSQVVGVCHGKCRFGPNVFVSPGDVWYCGVTDADIRTIIRQHLIGGQPVERLIGREPSILELDVTLPWE
jgi:(2Fe-2S) ferredoxin